MAGVRFPEVKEEGRRRFGPGDMEGIGHPLSVARTSVSVTYTRGSCAVAVAKHGRAPT
jgi:hypothetical protein